MKHSVKEHCANIAFKESKAVTMQPKNLYTPFLLFITLVGLVAPCFAQKGKNRDARQNQQRENSNRNRKSLNVKIEVGNIILGSPTSSSIAASIILEKDAQGYIEYYTERSKNKTKTSVFKADNSEPIEINITGLRPNTQYLYRLNYKKVGEANFTETNESWFATQKDVSTSFSFGVQGDSHPEREGKMFHPELYRQTLNNVALHRPDFYFMLGDDFNIDHLLAGNSATRENVESIYKVQRHYLGVSGSNPPLFLVNGNHEQAAKYLLNGTPNNAAVQAGRARKVFFPLPAPNGFYSGNEDTVQYVGLLKDYYAFEWGNALFVVIDPYWHSDVAVDNQPYMNGAGDERKKKDPWSATLGNEQYNWLKKTLESTTAKFKFIFAHHVNGTGRGGVERATFFEWGGYAPNGQWQFDRFRPGWEMPIHQLMVKNKVTIFFQGHDHLFAKQELDGVVYQSVPNPADDTHTAFNREAYQSGDVLPNSGFLNITVSPTDVNVEYVRSYFKDNPSLSEEAKKNYSYIIKG